MPFFHTINVPFTKRYQDEKCLSIVVFLYNQRYIYFLYIKQLLPSVTLITHCLCSSSFCHCYQYLLLFNKAVLFWCRTNACRMTRNKDGWFGNLYAFLSVFTRSHLHWLLFYWSSCMKIFRAGIAISLAREIYIFSSFELCGRILLCKARSCQAWWLVPTLHLRLCHAVGVLMMEYF